MLVHSTILFVLSLGFGDTWSPEVNTLHLLLHMSVSFHPPTYGLLNVKDSSSYYVKFLDKN